MEEINNKLFKHINYCISPVFVHFNVFADAATDGTDASGKRKHGNDGGSNGESGGHELGSSGK